VNFTTIALAACGLLMVFQSATAQDRMPPIPRDKMTEAQQKTAAELSAGPRGEVAGPFVPLLRSPEFMSRLQKTGEYLRYHSAIGQRLTEFTILLTSRRWTQNYEWHAHSTLAVKAGVKPETVEAIRQGRRPEAMAEDEEIVYEFIGELQKNQSVSDATYERALKRFGEQGIIDMIGVTGYYTMLSMIMNVSRTPLPPGEAPKLAPFPR